MDDSKQTPTTIDTTTVPVEAGSEIGYSGTYNYHGYITAEEYNLQLVGKLGLQVYDTMRRSDATVHAALSVTKDPIIGADWMVEAASDDPVDIEIAEYVNRELFKRNIAYPDLIREALTALDFGHALFEKVYEITEFNGKPRIGLKAIKSRKQRSILRWAIGQGDAEKPGVTQILQGGQSAEIPRAKLVYVINEREGENYEGISLLRFAYKHWKIKDAIEIMNAIALERMSVGIPILTKGVGGVTVGEPELIKVRKALRAMRANEEGYIELPDGTTLAMLDMKAQSTKDNLPTIEHQNSQITLSVLAQFLMLGQTGGSGSRAVSADHSTLFMKSLEAVARTIQIPFQTDIVNSLVDLNYSNLKNGYPKLVYSDLSDDDASALGTAIASLKTAGAITMDPDLENRIRTMFGLPELTEEMYDNYAELHAPVAAPNPDEDPDEDNPGGTDKNTPDDKTAEVDKAKKTTPTDPKQTKQTKSSVLADARRSQRQLIDIIVNKRV